MVFDTLLTTLVTRLNWDAFFSDPAKGVRAIAENRMDLATELDTALASLGMACVVAITDVQPDELGADHGAVIVTVTLIAMEIPLVNRASSGTQKTAQQILVKALSLWGRPWTPDPNAWSASEFAGFTIAEANEETASVTSTMKFNFRTVLETVVEVLATSTGPSGQALATGSSEELLNSPTPP